MSTPLVRMFCHRGPVLAADIDIGGRYMATTGMDKQLKLWDLRMYKLLNQYSTHSPGTSVSISDMEILSASFGSSVHTWKKPFSSSQRELYLSHSLAGSQVVDVKFAPFEDVLGIGHKGGFSSIVVPGAGNPNFDSMELNPFRTKKQRQESEIYSLLEKLQPEMIVLDPNSIASCPQFCKDDVDSDAALKKDARSDGGMTKVKRKTRGRSTATRRMLKKKSNIIDQKMVRVDF